MRLTTFTALSVVFCSISLYAAPCVTGPPNFVANCGFENGDLTGWSLSGHDSGPGFNGIDYGVDALDARSGDYGAYLGGFGGVLNLGQPLTTTTGANYVISFWLAQSPAPVTPYLNSFNLNFGSLTLLSLTQVPNMAFTEYSFDALAFSSATSLTLGFRDDTGFFSIDDISVTPAAIPEPGTSRFCIVAALLLTLHTLRKWPRGRQRSI